ncbi:MAG: signal recognition particle-docking protein FtsY [Nanoarchaeota archaeon]|nr:signal recognition particle-docking protein FtsY [Nanoarchaeota archaeon]
MFNKLRERIQNWTKKITEKAKEPEEEPKKEIKVPMKAILPGVYEPDLDKLKETVEELVKQEKQKEETPAPEKEGFFKRIASKVNKVQISEQDFEIYSEELEMLLLENNVALEVAEKMIKELKERVIGKELLKKEIEYEIKDSLRTIVEEILVPPFDISEKIREKISDQAKEPYVILFCGINGSGKTTTIAKIADSLVKKKISCVIAASDTFRAASIEQIKEHAEKIGVKVISSDYGSDPASVAFDAVKYAKKNSIDCVLVDTAGRMHTAKNLLKEIEKIVKVCKPDLKIFVGESITGNDAIEQVKSFNWAIGIDGIVLTKADIDEKGGTALSVGYVTKKPILYLGTGQAYSSIEPFNKQKFIERLGL